MKDSVVMIVAPQRRHQFTHFLVCISVCLSVSLSVCLYMHVSEREYLWFVLSIQFNVLLLLLSVCLYVCVCVCVTLRESICGKC